MPILETELHSFINRLNDMVREIELILVRDIEDRLTENLLSGDKLTIVDETPAWTLRSQKKEKLLNQFLDEVGKIDE